MENQKLSQSPKAIGFSDFFQKSPQKTDRLHCPNPKCSYYHAPPKAHQWYKPHGKYETKAFGTVLRSRCMRCKKTFSLQTFSLDYYVKKPVDYMKLIRYLVTGSGQRNIWRFERLRVELIQMGIPVKTATDSGGFLPPDYVEIRD